VTDNLMPGTIAAIAAEEILQAKLKEFAGDERQWAIATLALCGKAAAFLRDSLQGLDSSISWGRPFTTYKHAIDWDWQSGVGQGRFPQFSVSEVALLDRSQLGSKVDRYIADHADGIILEYLSQMSTDYWLGFDAPYDVQSVIAGLMMAFEHSSGSQHRKDVEFSFLPLERLGILPIFKLWDSSQIPFGGVFFRFGRLVTNATLKKAYYPIDIGVIPFFDSIDQIDLSTWITEDSQCAWFQIFASIKSQETELSLPGSESRPFFPMPGNATFIRMDPAQLQVFAEMFQGLGNRIQELENKLTPIQALRSSPIRAEKALDGYVFHREKNGWALVFNGQKVQLDKDYVGLAYIQFLLKHPGQEIDAPTVMSNSISPKVEKTFAKIEGKFAETDKLGTKRKHLLEGLVSSQNDGDQDKKPADDAKQKTERYLKLGRRRKDVEAARDLIKEQITSCEDQEENIALLDRLDEIEAVLKENSSKMLGPADRMRTSVYKAIDRVKIRIHKENPEFASFLDNHIKSGMKLIYSPPTDNSVSWIF
jgi:hypothetical protein